MRDRKASSIDSAGGGVHVPHMIRKLRNTGRPIDIDDRLPELAHALREVPGLVAAYLYGSYGTPDQTPLSDVDLAVVYRAGEVPDFEQHLRLIGRVTGTLGEDDVSVTVLNRASVLFQRRVLREGRRLLVTDAVAHADFVESVIDRASDFDIDHRAFLREYDAALREDYGAGRPE